MIGTLCRNRKAAGSATDQDARTGMLIPSSDVAHTLAATGGGRLGSGRDGQDDFVIAAPLAGHHPRGDSRVETFVATDFRTGEFAESEVARPLNTRRVADRSAPLVVFQTRVGRNGRGGPKPIVDALTSAEGGTHADSKPHVAGSFGVRRLLPVECERCQGLPDGWTAYGIHDDGKRIMMSDSARYRMIGNSVAVPCVKWIARRIKECS